MQKTAPPNIVHLTATQLQLAHKLGIPVATYAQQIAQNPNWPMPAVNDVDEDEDDYDTDPNTQEIMNAPIKALRDMWEVRFGAMWVEVDSLDEEWDKIYGRLDQYDLFEDCDSGNWIKLKEAL